MRELRREDGERHGVKSATVSFMTQKLVIEADDDCFDAVLDEAQRACSKIEPDCVILR